MIKTYKLLSAQQIKLWDLHTIKTQNISSIELMERAGTNLFKKILKKEKISKKQKIYIFCGVGNNGGDGLVLGHLFKKYKFNVECIIVGFSSKASLDFEINLHRLKKENVILKIFNSKLEIEKKSVIIDAIFGTGLNRPAEGIAKEAIDFINQTKKSKILSIDIPSGLYVDKPNKPDDRIVKSQMVYTIELPKLSFFFPNNLSYVTHYEIVKIGLDKKFLQNLITDKYAYKIKTRKILKRKDNAYKNLFGHSLIITGSYGMMGAGILSSKASISIGAGLVTAYIPKCGYIPFQTANPEIMVKTDIGKKHIKQIEISQNYNSLAIGPGIGMHTKTQKTVLEFISKQKQPIIIDADALNILSKHPVYLSKIPEKSILTPHPGEFKRLNGKSWNNDLEKLSMAKNFAKKNKIILVLKGAFTLITDGKKIYINPYANSALSTAGSGDVLTGIITGLISQGYSPWESAIFGVQIHSKTALNYNDKVYNKASMTAGDIIKNLKYL